MQPLEGPTVRSREDESDKGKQRHSIIVKITLDFEDTLKSLRNPVSRQLTLRKPLHMSNFSHLLKCTLLPGVVTFPGAGGP